MPDFIQPEAAPPNPPGQPPSPPPTPPPAPAPPAVGEQSRQPARMEPGEIPFWLALGVLLLAGLLLAGQLGVRNSSAATSNIYALLAVASLGGGSVLGFLFGIPHSRPDGGTTTPAAGAPLPLLPSTSLEQVSDWLTKIIIGVGLVEFNEVERRLARLGSLVCDATGSDAVTPQLLVVLFVVLGFLAAYIWARVYYGEIQSRADINLRSLQRKEAQFEQRITNVEGQQKHIQEQARQTQQQATAAQEQAAAATEAAAAAQTTSAEQSGLLAGLAQSTNASTLLPDDAAEPGPTTLGILPNATERAMPAWQQKLQQFMTAPAIWDSDPGKELFDSPAADDPTTHRHLQVAVTWRSANGRELYLAAEVQGEADYPLTGPVIFLLHPTFLRNRAKVMLAHPATASQPGGAATYSFSTAGSFTLVAIADEGRTILGYDLATLGPGGDW